MLNKEQTILKEVICNHLPRYNGREDELVTNWRDFNVERLVEQAMAEVGGYAYVDAHHYDFDDFSDSKTATISKEGHSWKATVGNITQGGLDSKAKAGDLRVVVYNSYDGTLQYYFMPKAGWESIREHGKSNRGKLRAAYSPYEDVVYKWKYWRVDSFEELAKKPATIVAPHQYMPRSRFSDLFKLPVDHVSEPILFDIFED
jgi:hypothetical protein